MNNRRKLKKEHLIISGVLMFAGIVLGVFSVTARTTSPSELIQYGMLEIIAGVFIMASGIVLLLSSVLSKNHQKINVLNCPKCGTAVPSKNDKFCRVCGEILSN